MVTDNGRTLDQYAGQLAFHQSTHKYRILTPGNGWGKTTSMGAEVHWWATHTHPYQTTMTQPIQAVWFVKLKDQFELVRAQLRDQCFGNIAKWVDGKYVWPDGSTMFIGSADRGEDWMKWMGVPLDLCLFDEEPPFNLWKEMAMRRRAQRKTRYIIAATAMGGDSWMEGFFYTPWLEHHARLGLDEDRALHAQLYPQAFLWARGGILDNPAASLEDLAHYEEVTASMHPNERKVRLQGGFASWTGDPVFDPITTEWLEKEILRLEKEMGAGIVGMFEPWAIPRRAG